MKQKSADSSTPGSPMISAGEVGRYAFCPESWRLSRCERVRGPVTKGSVAGEVEHARWGNAVDQLESIRIGLRVLFALSIVACLLGQWGGHQ